jgi:hypothetical protein
MSSRIRVAGPNVIRARVIEIKSQICDILMQFKIFQTQLSNKSNLSQINSLMVPLTERERVRKKNTER